MEDQILKQVLQAIKEYNQVKDKRFLWRLVYRIRNFRHKKMRLIHEDERGKIWQLEIEGKEYILMFTVKGEVRGGDYHENIQHCFNVYGRALWIEKICLACADGKGEDVTIIQQGETYTSKRNVPHMMVSLDPSLVVEWVDDEAKNEYYRLFRDKIETKPT